LPDGFKRIRHYGFRAGGHRSASSDSAASCSPPRRRPPPTSMDYRERYRQLTGRSLDVCRSCGGPMRSIGRLSPVDPAGPKWCDSSCPAHPSIFLPPRSMTERRRPLATVEHGPSAAVLSPAAIHRRLAATARPQPSRRELAVVHPGTIAKPPSRPINAHPAQPCRRFPIGRCRLMRGRARSLVTRPHITFRFRW
jgi:hypothetical protein